MVEYKKGVDNKFADPFLDSLNPFLNLVLAN